MSLYFSEKFKLLRKARDLTQEQIADIFHISPQSVSRWETGANYPDVEILPHLAIYFKVTVDELLGTEAILGEENAWVYTRDIRNLLNSGRINDAIDLAHQATKEYPLNPGLHYHLVQALSAACSGQTPGYEENTVKYKDEIIAVSERIINLTDYKSSLEHRVQLIRQYAKWGMKEEAKKLLDTLPDELWHSREPWACLVLDGEELRKDFHLRIIRAKYLLEYFTEGYADSDDLPALQKIRCRIALMQISSLINSIVHDQADSPVNHLELAFDNIRIAELYCEAGDGENALEYVEKTTRDSMYHIDQMDKTNADGSNYMAWSTPRNLPWVLWEDHLAKPQFDFVRNDERFVKCFELLKANSRELK